MEMWTCCLEVLCVSLFLITDTAVWDAYMLHNVHLMKVLRRGVLSGVVLAVF